VHSCVAPQLVVGAGSKILRPRHGHADADADAAELGSTPSLAARADQEASELRLRSAHGLDSVTAKS